MVPGTLSANQVMWTPIPKCDEERWGPGAGPLDGFPQGQAFPEMVLRPGVRASGPRAQGCPTAQIPSPSPAPSPALPALTRPCDCRFTFTPPACVRCWPGLSPGISRGRHDSLLGLCRHLPAQLCLCLLGRSESPPPPRTSRRAGIPEIWPPSFIWRWQWREG